MCQYLEFGVYEDRGTSEDRGTVLLSLSCKQTGKYISQQKDLLEIVSPDERVIVETFLNLKNGEAVEFDTMSKVLFNWTTKWIEKTK